MVFHSMDKSMREVGANGGSDVDLDSFDAVYCVILCTLVDADRGVTVSVIQR